MKRSSLSLLAFALAATAACGGDAPASDQASTAEAAATSGSSTTPASVVDSVLPMPVMLDRFRADVPEVATLTSGADTRDALVQRVIEGLEQNDTTAFEPLAVNRAEWGWLYFPTSPIAQPPYEAPPSLAWLQLQEGNRKGALRALRELGGHELACGGYSCDPEPRQEGENRLWTGCRVTVARDGGDAVTIALFGAIMERNGRFAILSFANDF
jgi:hypothetical protein